MFDSRRSVDWIHNSYEFPFYRLFIFFLAQKHASRKQFK